MVTLVRMGGSHTAQNAEFYGKAKDVKPTKNVPNASIFYEMDTKKVFLFDEEDGVWLEQ